MVSSILEAVDEPAVEWTPRREALDPAAFDCGRVGPYALGPEIRCGPFGPVHLALGAHFDFVLELERVEVSGMDVPNDDYPFDGLGPRLLERLNYCVGLGHPHVAELLGAGLDGEVPYVLRRHTLGRTLGELMLDDVVPPPEVATGIVFGIAEALDYLAESGPRPGTCGLGGFDGHAVHVGWDGSCRLLGAGYALIRDRRLRADFESLRRFARCLEPSLGKLIEGAKDLVDAATRLRRWHRDDCAHRRTLASAWLRSVDPEGCAAYRRFFDLRPLSVH